MTRSGRKICLLFCIVFYSFTAVSQDLFSPENSIKFAGYLFDTQQYNLAASEYQRILTLQPQDTSLFPKLMDTYRLGNICQNSFNNLNTFGVTRFLKNNSVATGYLKLSLTCNCCYHQSDFLKALSSVSAEDRIFYRLGYYIINERKDSLINFAHTNYNFLNKSYPSVLSDIHKLENFRRKSPGLAAAMSAILPGSGKAYSKYWTDAIMSFIFVGSNAWLSYRGFKKKGVKSATGWIFGTFSFGFYLGNVWGSGHAAKTYNNAHYQIIYDDAKNSVYNRF